MSGDCWDVAVVGGGAAGLAAYRALARRGFAVILVEARARLGGRGLTLPMPGNYHFDAGCQWLHSADRNPLATLAQQLGFEIIESPSYWFESNVELNFPEIQQSAFCAAWKAFDERLAQASRSPDDTAAAACLEPGNPWNPLIEAINSYESGADLSRLSVHDVANYRDTGENWRIREGYGSLIAMLGHDVHARCRISSETVVTKIDHSGHVIAIETSRGRLRCRRLIVTLPTSLLPGLRFVPHLPDKVAAAAGVPLGFAEKVLLHGPDDLPADAHLFGAPNRADTGSYDMRPMGQPYIEAFFGGQLARELERKGELAEFAVEELVGVLGSSFRGRIRPVATSAWATDPFTMGGYSHALPGRASDREILAMPVDDRLFFAGEATSSHSFSTAHGAFETGLRAADEVVRVTRPGSMQPGGRRSDQPRPRFNRAGDGAPDDRPGNSSHASTR